MTKPDQVAPSVPTDAEETFTPTLKIVFDEDLAAFRASLIEQLNGAFASMARRIERRLVKRLGDRAEALAVSVLREAGYESAVRHFDDRPYQKK